LAEMKLLPSNPDAEEAVIGSLVINGDMVNPVSKIIKPQDFYFESCRYIYEAALSLYHRREGINQVTLGQELSRAGNLEIIGGAARLSYLASICPTSLDAEFYADIVRRLSVCRQTILAGEKISALGYEESPETDKMLANITDVVESLKKGNTISKHLVTPVDSANVVMNLIEIYQQEDNAIASGFYDLDRITTGFYKGELTIIGARPSVGKTQIMLDMAENMADRKTKILFCSVEMNMMQIMERKASRRLQIPVHTLRRRELDTAQLCSLSELAGEVSVSPIYYLAGNASSGDIENEVGKMVDTTGLDIVFVDYLQRLTDCWDGRENMNIRTGKVSWTLKTIAQKYKIPVIAASQLNRGLETRENKRPTLGDLRDSGAIEQDADNVLLLYRADDNPSYLEIKQAKNRQLGETPAISLLWHKDFRRYVDATRQ
jgi:replicative DNA helicase